jgi:hypothetical protein
MVLMPHYSINSEYIDLDYEYATAPDLLSSIYTLHGQQIESGTQSVFATIQGDYPVQVCSTLSFLLF